MVNSQGDCQTANFTAGIPYKSLYNVVSVLFGISAFHKLSATTVILLFLPQQYFIQIRTQMLLDTKYIKWFPKWVLTIPDGPKTLSGYPWNKNHFIKIQRHYLHFLCSVSKDSLHAWYTHNDQKSLLECISVWGLIFFI